MVLYGDVRMNRHIIAFWDAQRIDPMSNPHAAHTYTCRYTRIAQAQRRWSREFTVQHIYSDGAEVLAALVMMRAAELLRETQAQQAT
jgi:hypothetical protein